VENQKTSIQLEVEDANGIAIYKSLLGGEAHHWIAEAYLENPDRHGVGYGKTMPEALEEAIANVEE